MIQQISPPPTNPPLRNPAPVNQPVQLNQAPTPKPANSLPFNALARYEQTQKFLKDQILSVQNKSKNLKDTERTLLIQSIFALSTSLALVLVFIFFFFPLLIRFAGNLSNLAVFPQTDTIPPSVPTFAAPVEATQESSITLSGFGEPKSKVILVKNGSEAGNVVVGDSGEFNLEVNLDEGENKIAAYSVDLAKNESSMGKQYTVKFDQTPPEIDWQSPEENKVVKNLREQSVEVKGKVNESAKVYLNDQFISNSSDGSFDTQFMLKQGDNILTLKAVDVAQNETQVERTVSFKP
ncbi:MAG: Ig-like domain-containing protein [Patescibacteria group bacterium]